MKTSAFALLLILLLGVFLPLLSTEVFAEIQNELSLHELLLNKQVFTRDETLNITVRANVETVPISVYSPDDLFLSYNQAANTSATFLIDGNWSFGSWNVTANFNGTLTSSFFTVLNDGDYVNASLPYSNVHLGINYTVSDEGVNAALLSTNRTLAVTYPAITSLNQTVTTVEYNNMSVRTSTFSGNDTFIVTYAFAHLGVELTVNGSTAVSNNFEFSVNSSGTQRDKFFRSGNVVFDWSDIASTSWSNETKTLSVDIGSPFEISAFIYADGFEGGDITGGGWGWYGYEPSVVSASNSTVWKGNYSCLISSQGDSGLIRYIDGNDPATVNLRAYFYISSLPSINQSASLAWITGMYDMGNESSISYGVAAVLAYLDENHSRIGLSQPWNSSESPVFNESPTLISADSWFCLEIGINSTGGYLWINGALEVVNTAYASQGQLNEGSIFIGNAYLTGGYLPDSIYVDEIAYSDPYIGEAISEFPNLGITLYDFGGIASSLSVVGTVHLYSSIYCQGYEKSFTDTFVNLTDYPMIWLISSWNDHPYSLEVQGTVTLFEHINCQGKFITFTNRAMPYDNLGNVWNTNPDLIKSQGSWDCKSHNWVAPLEWLPWTMISSDCIEDPPSSSNKMNWASDGCAAGHSSDDLSQWWKCCDLAQGYERNAQGPNDLSLYPRDWPLNWNDVACSLKVTGSVTLYEAANWQDQLGNPYSSDVPNLEGYCNRVSSLSISGRVTLYDQPNYQGHSIIFDCSCSNPLEPLPVSSQSAITLEAIVSNANDNLQASPLSASWTGAKFDVWVVEDKDSGAKFMLELYFIRGGGNLDWQFRGGDDRTVHHAGGMLMAIDAFPEYASRTIYSNGYVKWTLDIKGIVQYACNHNVNMHFASLKIAKIAFTLESASNVYAPFPSIGCDVHRFRLCYGGLRVGCSSSGLASVASAASSGFVSRYNSLGLGNSVTAVGLTQDTAAGTYQGLLTRQYDVVLTDRIPTGTELLANPSLRLWAIGYNGVINPNNPFSIYKVLWAVTNGVPARGNEYETAGIFTSYIRRHSQTLSVAARSDFAGTTQYYPDGRVTFSDIVYFVDSYIAYNGARKQVKSYADFNVDGIIDFSDLVKFVDGYIAAHGGAYTIDSITAIDEMDASENATLSLNAPAVLPNVGEYFNVTLRVDNVSGLWGWGASLQWDPEVFELTDIIEGSFLSPSGNTLFLSAIDGPSVADGVLQDMGSAKKTCSSVSGSGVLAVLTFKVLSSQSSSIDFLTSILYTPDYGSDHIEIPHTPVNLNIN